MEKPQRLAKVNEFSTGQRAILRREVGKLLEEASTPALHAFYWSLPDDTPSYQHEQYFAVVTMMCLWKKEDSKHPKPFAQCICALLKDPKKPSDSENKRFFSLLDTPWEKDGYLVAKLARYARHIRGNERGMYPDFEALLEDSLKWNHPKRFVQRRWMQDYFRDEEAKKTDEKNSK